MTSLNLDNIQGDILYVFIFCSEHEYDELILGISQVGFSQEVRIVVLLYHQR